MSRHIFLSYSRKDNKNMLQVKKALLDANYVVWTDEGIVPGTPDWKLAIENALNEAHCVVVLLSPNAKKSVWVRRELSYAGELSVPIYPLMIRGKESNSLPIELVNAQYIGLRKKPEIGIERLIITLSKAGITPDKIKEEDHPHDQFPLDSGFNNDAKTAKLSEFISQLSIPLWMWIGIIGIFTLGGVWLVYRYRGSVEIPQPIYTPSVSMQLTSFQTKTATDTPIITVSPTFTQSPTILPTRTVTPSQLALPTQTVTPSSTSFPTTYTDAWDHEMVLVPSGSFTMGSEEYTDTQPIHLVYLDSYYIDKYEVTNDKYAVFLNVRGNQMESGTLWLDKNVRIHKVDGQWEADPGYSDHPVIGVTWYGAVAYFDWRGARLPTEAEWEKAARGTDDRFYPWGNDELNCDHANQHGCVMDTTPVGSYPEGASPYGIMDMAGNVKEWTSDWYDAQYYERSPSKNPKGASSGAYRVMRGGSWYQYYEPQNVVYRFTVYYPNKSRYFTGFRCALSP